MKKASQSIPSRLQTGIDSIDDEHRVLLDLHSRLVDCCCECKDSCSTCTTDLQEQCADELFSIYADLVGFMSTHFIHEESLMGNCPSEWVAQHKFEHAEIATKLTAFIGRTPRGSEFVTPRELVEFIYAWVEDHITKWDIPLARFLKGEPSLVFS